MTKEHLIHQIQQKKSYLCVGLDTDLARIPAHLQSHPNAVVEFNKQIIDATKDLCVSYKINTAFYEAMGLKGWEAMQETVAYIPEEHFTIADAKRGDIGNTSSQYAKAFFEVLNFDAITVAPYMGEDSIRPFLAYPGKWTIVLGLTSNKGSEDFQKLMVSDKAAAQLPLVPGIVDPYRPTFLYQRVIEKITTWGTTNNLMFVTVATRAADFEGIRAMIPDHFLLVPGVGFQGGSLEEVSKYGLNKEGGLLVNASRAIIYASENEDFAREARAIATQYQQEMSRYLQPVPA